MILRQTFQAIVIFIQQVNSSSHTSHHKSSPEYKQKLSVKNNFYLLKIL